MTREKSVGAFPNDVRDAVEKQCMQLAVYANRRAHINDIPSKKLCDILVEPHRREFARDVALTFAGNLSSDVYETLCAIPLPTLDLGLEEGKAVPAYQSGGVAINLNWSSSKAFARITTDTNGFYRDTNPELIERIISMVHEFLHNGVEYNFVVTVWLWVNKFCATGDKAHARWLFPGIVPLLSRIEGHEQLADQVQRMKYPTGRKPVPLDMVPALQHANDMVAAVLMLGTPDYPVGNPAMAWLTVSSNALYEHPLLPNSIEPIVQLNSAT